jgi:hypothetical protein
VAYWAVVGLLAVATGSYVASRADSPAGGRAEPVVEPRSADPGPGAVAARLPPDTRALAIPVTLGAPPVEVGDRVDLLAVIDPTIVDGGPAGLVARRALIVHHTDELVTVAVERDEVADVALALAAGNVVLALAGPG